MNDCALCTNLTHMLGESENWRLALNRNQNLLGKCVLALRRHSEKVTDLTPAEWAELHIQLRAATEMLSRAFAPDHFNYAFLQNQDRHVHMHIIPRYAGERTFAGLVFTDPDYPDHYAVPMPVRLINAEQMALLADLLRGIQGA
jgi:diadenosine tetraphosphate (Ap4A) HIT family hydrolase